MSTVDFLFYFLFKLIIQSTNQKYNEVKNKYLPKINLKNIEISVKEITDNETNEIAVFY